MDKSKVLVLGRGFLGSTFERHGYEVVGRDVFDYTGIEEEEDFGRWHSLFLKYDVVINCIARSDTRWCENPNNFDELMDVNGQLPKRLSRACEYADTKFVHISTGCLYDTRGAGASDEASFMSAHCNYVVSKWAGEGYLSNQDLIIRPRLIFDSAKAVGRNNLIQKLPKYEEFLNEYNSITSNDTIVESIEALLDNDQKGIFNVANTGVYTMHQIAEALGYFGTKISQEELHKSQGLYLVNNVMDLTKLLRYYTPRDTLEEVKRCQNKMSFNT